MNKGLFSSLAALLACAAVASAQPGGLYPPSYPAMGAWNGAAPGVYAPVEWLPPAPESSCDGDGVCPGPVVHPDCHHCNPKPFYEGLWLSGDLLLFRVKDGPLPTPVATTGPAGATPGTTAILGQTGTSVLAGRNGLDFHTFPGGRLTAGFWFDPCHPCIGMEGGAFALDRQDATVTATSDGTGSPPISVPFTDAITGAPSVLSLAFPGVFAGGVNVTATSRLWGSDINLTGLLYRGHYNRVTMMSGFRYLDLDEDLLITDRTAVIAGGPGVIFFGGAPVGGGVPGIPNGLVIQDSFITRNQFYGGQMGGRYEFHAKRFYFDVTVKTGLGVTHERLATGGLTTLIPAAGAPVVGPTALNGGFFVVPGNSGVFKKNELSTMGEAQLRVGMDIAYGISTFIGYNALYLSRVVRPGEQLPNQVDATQVPASPTFTPGFQTPPPSGNLLHSSYWAQGALWGLQFRY